MQRPDRSLPPAPIEDSSPSTPTATTINRGWFSSFKLMATKPAMSKTWTKKGKEPVSPGVARATGGSGGNAEHETGAGQREDRDHRKSDLRSHRPQHNEFIRPDAPGSPTTSTGARPRSVYLPFGVPLGYQERLDQYEMSPGRQV